MKKLLLVLFCVLFAASFAGCGEKGGAAPGGQSSVDSQEKESGRRGRRARREQNASDSETQNQDEQTENSTEQ